MKMTLPSSSLRKAQADKADEPAKAAEKPKQRLQSPSDFGVNRREGHKRPSRPIPSQSQNTTPVEINYHKAISNASCCTFRKIVEGLES